MSDLHDKHRQRMDEKSEAAGLCNLPDHEVLEKLLFAVIPRGNTNEIAKELCDRFDGIGNVFYADVDELMETKGVGKRVAYFLHELPEILGVVERSLAFKNKRINNREEACRYAATLFNNVVTEHFYVISLSSTGLVIRHHKMAEGVPDNVHIYTRNVAQIALKDKAHSVIIAHNHPGGTAEPSFADVKATEDIAAALNILGIELYESVIVAQGKGKSILDSELCSIKR